VQLIGDIQFLQVSIKSWADDSPFEPAITAAQGRHGQGCDTPFLVVGEQKFESADDVTDVCNLPPMVLSREIDDPRLGHAFEQIESAQTDFAGPAATFVILEHFGKSLLELKRDAL